MQNNPIYKNQFNKQQTIPLNYFDELNGIGSFGPSGGLQNEFNFKPDKWVEDSNFSVIYRAAEFEPPPQIDDNYDVIYDEISEENISTPKFSDKDRQSTSKRKSKTIKNERRVPENEESVESPKLAGNSPERNQEHFNTYPAEKQKLISVIEVYEKPSSASPGMK